MFHLFQVAPVCCAQLLSHVWGFVAPWTVACLTPLSMGLSQARLLQWVPISSSRVSSQPNDQTSVSYVTCIGFTIETPGKPRTPIISPILKMRLPRLLEVNWVAQYHRDLHMRIKAHCRFHSAWCSYLYLNYRNQVIEKCYDFVTPVWFAYLDYEVDGSAFGWLYFSFWVW